MHESAGFWALAIDQLLLRLGATETGLSSAEADRRILLHGANKLATQPHSHAISLFVSQFKSPITLILILAVVLSAFLGERSDAFILLGIIVISAVLGFWQEFGAARALDKLLALVRTTATVQRDRKEVEIALDSVVPGDIVVFSAGGAIPGDCRLLDAKDLFVDEAALTGETYPVEKQAGVLPPETLLAQRTNVLYLGTHVVSGTGRALVVATGRATEFGRISKQLQFRRPETEFEHGVRRFGYFLVEVTLLLVVAIFAFNVALHRPVIDSFLFSLALAVGLTPQLLPAIISVNLAHGAKRMAERGVIIRRLAAIENFGSMDVLCSDKTGTLTEGEIRIEKAVDAGGLASDRVLRFAYLNAIFESGFVNPIDTAIRSSLEFDISDCRKLDEIPYDFVRKRLSVLVAQADEHFLVTKGAVDHVLPICANVELKDGSIVPLSDVRDQVHRLVDEQNSSGNRALAVAYRQVCGATTISHEDESGMVFLGFLILADRPKPDIVETVRDLQALGTSLKIVSGDNRRVATTVAHQVGLSDVRLLTGTDLRNMSDAALTQQVAAINVFAEIEPNQKERIIIALRKSGHVVGYLGDGINDASALHAADVGISVDTAVDVAKEAADIVLLKRDLSVLVQGVREGRTTFANTIKYVYMATSANFGNMFSVAGASLFLPFLPMLPKQILLTNLLTDLPEMTIATDNVDPELVEQPRRWNVRSIRNFMVVFGTISSVFDFLTFGALWLLLGANQQAFRTGWFLESVVSATLIVLVIRSRQPLFRSWPSFSMALVTCLVIVTALTLPWIPLAAMLGFGKLSWFTLIVLLIIVAAYVAAAEFAKRIYFRSSIH